MKHLKQLRESRGLSQQKLANYFHLSQQSIYKYENGLAEPDMDMLKQFAEFFDTSVDYLVEYTDDVSAHVSAEPSRNHLTSTENRLLTYYRMLSPRLREIVFDLVKESSPIDTEATEDPAQSQDNDKNTEDTL